MPLSRIAPVAASMNIRSYGEQTGAAVPADEFRSSTPQRFEDAVSDMKTFARRGPEFEGQEV